MLFGQAHVDRYRETNGEVGHQWQPGVFTLLLTTTGRRTGRNVTTPLIYGEDGDDYVIIASKGGADSHPDWYENLAAHHKVELQVGADTFPAEARTASPEEKERLWPIMAEIWPDFDNYVKKTDRDIPLVILHPAS